VSANPIIDACKNESLRKRNMGVKLRKISILLFKNSKKLHAVYLKAARNCTDMETGSR
jgi:hypothetical protein